MIEHIAQDSETSKRSLIRPNGIRKKQGQIQEDRYTYIHLINYIVIAVQTIWYQVNKVGNSNNHATDGQFPSIDFYRDSKQG